jgi:protease-4
MHFHELMNKIGVSETTIKTGKMKDAGSPYRETTEEEKQYFESLLMDVYDQFVTAVAEQRHLKVDYVKKYADGRVFTGRQAVSYGFVDTLGTMEDATKYAGKLGHVYGEPKVVKEVKRKTIVERLMGDAASEVTNLKEQILQKPVLQYRFAAPN